MVKEALQREENKIGQIVSLCTYILHMHVYICSYVCLYISEMNNSNDIRDGEKELELFCLRYSYCPGSGQCYLKVKLD